MKRGILKLFLVFVFALSAVGFIACDGGNPSNSNQPSGHTHNFARKIEECEPTCTEDGYAVYMCTGCEQTVTRVTESALGHDFDLQIDYFSPTCTEDGYYVYECIRCGETENRTDENSAYGHTFDEYMYTVDPTCTEDGYDVYGCIRCAETENRNYQDATGHNWAEYYQDPTCTEVGYTVHYCMNFGCDERYIDNEVPASGHTYSESWTCDEDYHWHAANCGHDEIKDKAEHVFENGFCTTCNMKEPVRGVNIKLINDEDYTLSGDVISRNIPYSEDYCLLRDAFEFSPYATKTWSRDVDFNDTVSDPGDWIYNLNEGENVWYIKVANKGETKIYTLSIYRQKRFRAYFNVNPDNLPIYPSGTMSYSDYVLEGELLSPPNSDPYANGYTFSWNFDFTEPVTKDMLVDGVIPVNGVWTPRTDLTYTIKHVFQKANGGYDSYTSETTDYCIVEKFTNGVMGATVTATPKTVEHFTFNENYSSNKLSGIVNASSSNPLVLYVYYSREMVNVKIAPEDANTFIKTSSSSNVTVDQNFYYGAAFTQTYMVTTKGGYIFDGWYDKVSETVISTERSLSNLSLTADMDIVTKVHLDDGLKYFNYTSDIYGSCTVNGLKDEYKGLNDIYIPDTVTSINTNAFKGNRNIFRVRIGVKTRFGSYNQEFFGCDRLVEVINESPITITAGSRDNGYVAYYAKNVYTSEEPNAKLSFEGDYVYYDKENEGILVAYVGSDGVVNMPEAVKARGNYAFWENTTLTEVTIGENVAYIGDYAFGSCSSLKTLNVPESVKEIKEFAFSNCTGLTKINGLEGLEILGDSAFQNCSKLTSFYLNANFSEMGYSVFYYDYKLVEFKNDSGKSVKNYDHISSWAYQTVKNEYSSTSGASKLTVDEENKFVIYTDGTKKILIDYFGDATYLDLPDIFEEIGTRAFMDNKTLTEVKISNNTKLKTIKQGAFSKSNIDTITIPANVTYLEREIFYGCVNLRYFFWKANTDMEMPSALLYDCKSLTYVELPTDHLIGINSDAFTGCSSLYELTIPVSVQYMNSSVFRGCNFLAEITNYSKNVTFEVGGSNYGAGDSVRNVRTAYGDAKKVYLDNNTGFIIFDNSVLIGYTRDADSVVIPSSIVEINKNAFTGKNLSSVTFERNGNNGVKKIGKSAFSYCANLKEIIGLDGVTEIGEYAFYQSGLEEIAFNGVATVEAHVLENCNYLESVTFGDSVTEIKNDVLINCKNLKSITLSNSVETIGSYAFGGSSPRNANLTDIYYGGTKDEFNSITISSYWNYSFNANQVTVHCAGGEEFFLV